MEKNDHRIEILKLSFYVDIIFILLIFFFSVLNFYVYVYHQLPRRFVSVAAGLMMEKWKRHQRTDKILELSSKWITTPPLIVLTSSFIS